MFLNYYLGKDKYIDTYVRLIIKSNTKLQKCSLFIFRKVLQVELLLNLNICRHFVGNIPLENKLLI